MGWGGGVVGAGVGGGGGGEKCDVYIQNNYMYFYFKHGRDGRGTNVACLSACQC